MKVAFSPSLRVRLPR